MRKSDFALFARQGAMAKDKVETRGRKRKYANAAERRKAYILRHGINENKRKAESRRRNNGNNIDRLIEWKEKHPDHKPDYKHKWQIEKRKSRKKRMSIPFIAFDGEGITTNQIQCYLRSKDDANDGLPAYRQNYVILTASDGRYIENWKTGLSTKDCLDFLLSYAGDNYLVGFGIGYDVTKMLHTELTPDELRKLWKEKAIDWQGYHIGYIPNKILTIKKDDQAITLYDTRAFFQMSFIKALENWKIGVPDSIRRGKEQRRTFTLKDKQEIREYNLYECILLVELMDKMRAAMNSIDMLPHQWYGVGALANVVMQERKIQMHIETPKKMIPLFLQAYYGGRNQTMKLGEFDVDVYLHDINSAYPHAMTELPSSIGKWSECAPKFYNYPYTLYKVQWKLPPKTLITPFPVRSKGNIYYPLQGVGMYWQPEVEAAMQHYSKYITIKQCWFFDPVQSDVRPFDFYQEYYAQRQQFIKDGNDAQLVLKLALNAGYGKLAQSIGGKIFINAATGEITYSLPAYQNYFWAGMITSKCRAKVFQLAMQKPKSVIAFATDGVAATEKLTNHSSEKALGCWEIKAVQNYFIAQTGVYTYKDADVEKFKSRGFGYKSIDYNKLREQWRAAGVYTSFHYTENRFVGIGAGLQRNQPELIGCWLDFDRKLIFYPQSMRIADERDAEMKYKGTGFHSAIQLAPPLDMGISEGYTMKQNWLESMQDQEMQDDLDQMP